MKVEKTVNEQAIRWKLTDEVGKSRVEVFWAYGCPNAVVLNYDLGHSDHTCALLPISLLDELITVSRNRPDLGLEPLDAAELSKLPQQRFGKKTKETNWKEG